jgi:hypothetical protein
MILNGALLLLVRGVSTALLAMVGGKWVAAYFLGDMGLYYLYKLLRRDFTHWLAVEGAFGVFVHGLERSTVKIMVDFTGVIQMRHGTFKPYPYPHLLMTNALLRSHTAGEEGGCYWTFSMILALGASFFSTHVYLSSSEDKGELEAEIIWKIVGGMSAGWLAVFLVFLLTIKRKYAARAKRARCPKLAGTSATSPEPVRASSGGRVRHMNLAGTSATSPAPGEVREVSSRQPLYLPASAADKHLHTARFARILRPTSPTLPLLASLVGTSARSSRRRRADRGSGTPG